MNFVKVFKFLNGIRAPRSWTSPDDFAVNILIVDLDFFYFVL